MNNGRARPQGEVNRPLFSPGSSPAAASVTSAPLYQVTSALCSPAGALGGERCFVMAQGLRAGDLQRGAACLPAAIPRGDKPRAGNELVGTPGLRVEPGLLEVPVADALCQGEALGSQGRGGISSKGRSTEPRRRPNCGGTPGPGEAGCGGAVRPLPSVLCERLSPEVGLGERAKST